MRAEKQSIIEEVQRDLEGSEFVLLADCRGLKVDEFNELRDQLRANGAGCKVVKNSFLKVISKRLGWEGMDEYFSGPTTMVVGEGEVTAIAKLLKTYRKQHELPVMKGGRSGATVWNADDVDVLAEMPPREVMLGQLVGTIAAPMTQIVGVLQQKVLSLLYVLKAVENKKSGDA